ncbi:uncharacterized protein LOC123313360 [Coccinella septempunctata]|uniref:uncharacterized protein LOC123313360 n=1 Tax=Coccinella septempunctata TaxID=41139 RepID=UPI001D0810E9|nr:uncharacterized protein LOC123313360 [Coccinella septempunctata]
MKVKQKVSHVGIDDALNGLHLSNPQKNKRRLSGIGKSSVPSIDRSAETDKSHPSTSEDHQPTMDSSKEEQEPVIRRTTRKKSAPVRWDPQNSVIKKKTLDTSDEAEVQKYYLNKNFKKVAASLETIYEEGAQMENSHKIMGNKKFRRFLQFEKVTKGKIKKRKEKAQKFCLKKKTIKATLNELYKKLSFLEGEDC